MKDLFELGGKFFNSRLLTGTGKYSTDEIIPQVTSASESQIITVALRRVDFDSPYRSVMDYIPPNIQLLPNTSGARDAKEAIKIAQISRASGHGNFIKIEVISDNKYLLPNGYETLKATEELSKDGFIVLPYVNADLYLGRSLKDAGAAAIMPLGSPIGSNRGIRCMEMIRVLVELIDLPIIVDAGIGKPSDAAVVMEMGVDACLVNTAIASSPNPILMASAFKDAVISGRNAYLAGLGCRSSIAVASSPLTGFLNG
ncbi:thiazole synthase [Thiospirochaeta perfilievii]|uniref:Thiazole synthase n=1 Tax=Thiospirochaeta perfilievii TaxID=252967 RepID=A0A5C1QEP2_9SPIO|nr:thiazole synthase [Thiospirochaeta perfilievii]QEN05867.1 thiazole synthase [Thiospirochaeta perfilievii]